MPSINSGNSAAEESATADSTNVTFGLARKIEALLFIADHALTPDELAVAVGTNSQDVRVAIDQLTQHYETRGITILEHREAIRLVSAPDLAEICRSFLGLDHRTHLSQAALETLGIVAYRQGVTRAEIEHVRGVDSDSALATLLSRNLIVEAGRLDAPGRPSVFTTTDTFMAYFGITSLDHLPELDLAPPPADAT